MLTAVRQRQVMDYLFIIGTVVLTVYGQLVIKWQVASGGPFPVDVTGRIEFLVRLLLNPWVISGLAAAFLASVSWMAAMTKFELSYAYPFTSLAFVLVLGLSAVFFREAITVPKVLAVAFIIAGIVIGGRG